jgi:two-component sensor histidine kinase
LILLFIAVMIYHLKLMNNTVRKMDAIVNEKLNSEKAIQDASLIITSLHSRIWDTLFLDISKRTEIKKEMDDAAGRFYSDMDLLIRYLPANTDSITQIRKYFYSYYTFSKSIIDTIRPGELSSFSDINSKFRENRDKISLEFRKTFDSISREYENSLISLNHDLIRERWIVVIITILMIVMSILLALLIAEVQIRPIIRLSRWIASQYALNLDQDISEFRLRESGELKMLIKAFSDLRIRLRDSFSRLNDEILTRKAAEEQVKAALSEKEALLRELYHRTRNNMQVVSAMLTLKSDNSTKSLESLITNIKGRIQAMSLVHQKLYQSQNLSSIRFNDYIADLVQYLRIHYSVPPDKIDFKVETEPLNFVIDLAIPAGLILFELISNAILYAFPGEKKGEIIIRMKRLDNQEIQIEVSDNGIGIQNPSESTKSVKDGIGFVQSLTIHQLQGEVTFSSHNGVSCLVLFPDKGYSPRI